MVKKYLLIIVVAIFTSCESYLDHVPEDDIITIEKIFEKRADALLFLNGCYISHLVSAGNIIADPAMTGADEFVTNEYYRKKAYAGSFYSRGFSIATGLQSVSNPITPYWGFNEAGMVVNPHAFDDVYQCIRRCNIVIANIDNVYNMSLSEKQQFKAEAKAQKALYYFELIRKYGPICLIPENISVEASMDDIQVPRSHVDTCFNRAVKLFDEAIPYLKSFRSQSTERYGFMNKEAAMGWKAKTLLYQASPLFNGNSWYSQFKNRDGETLFSSEYDPDKWKKAAKACDEAVAYCELSGFELENSFKSEDSEKLNQIRNIQFSVMPIGWTGNELIAGIYTIGENDLKTRLPYWNKDHNLHNIDFRGSINPTLKMVELFYTENGLPITSDKNWNYTNRYRDGIEKRNSYSNIVSLNKKVLNLHLKREPRFYANIAFDKGMWSRGGSFYEMNAKKNGTNGLEEDYVIQNKPQNISGYWVKKFLSPYSIGGKDPSYGSSFPFPKLRLAELYLMQAEAWNEFEGPSSKVYDALNVIRERAGIPTVQESWNMYSTNPSKITTKEGMREIIQQEKMIEFSFEGHRFWDLRRWKKAHEYMNTPIKGWDVFGETDEEFYNQYNGPVVVWRKNKFESPRDYFWPIRDEEILKSNVVQNIGW